MLSICGHLIWKESTSNWENNFRPFISISFPLEFSSTNQSYPPVHDSSTCSVWSLLLWTYWKKICRCLVSGKAGQTKCYHSATGADSTHWFYSLALWCQILRFFWQLEGRLTFLLFLSTSGNMVVALSSRILSPKSLRKSHGYLVGSPWQWRKPIISNFFVKHLLLVTVWLIPCAGEQGSPNCRLMRSRGSGRDILQQLRRWGKFKYVSLPTWEFTQNDTEFGFFSSGCCRPNFFHWECPLDPCSLWMAWLAPSPSKQKKVKLPI